MALNMGAGSGNGLEAYTTTNYDTYVEFSTGVTLILY
jgi:hypothetical protein